MSTEDRVHKTRDGQLAVGFVVTDDNLIPVLQDIAQTRNRGCEVFVTYRPSVDSEKLDIVAELGATVVEPVIESGRIDLYNTFLNVLDARSLVVVSHLGGILDYVLFDDDIESIDIEMATEHGTDVLIDRGNSVANGHVDRLSNAPEPQRDTPDAVHGEMTTEVSTFAVIPAYNEAGTIASVVRSVNPYVDEVLVVDDGSSDGTADIAREAGATVIEHETNRGYGAALNTAFEAAFERSASTLVTLDADGQHDPNDVSKLLQTLEETGADIVIGSRFVEGASTNAPFYRRFGLKVINLMTNLSMGVVRRRSRITDTQSGFRAYNERAIRSINRDSSIGDQMNASIDILYHAHHNDYQLEEIGVEIDYDVENASSHHPLAHGLSLVSNILKTVELERPLTVLGVPGFFGLTIGILIAYITISNYLTTGVFELGLAVTSTVFVFIGLLACFTAIILHSMSRLFEMGMSWSQNDSKFRR